MKQSGFSFIEILIGLSLSILMLIAMAKSVAIMRSAYLRQQAIIISDNHHLRAQQSLNQSIHQAGSFVCNHMTSSFTLLNDTESLNGLLGQDPIELIDGARLRRNPWVASSVLQRLKQDQPILWVKYVEDIHRVAENTWFESEPLYVPGHHSWKKNTWIFVSDCKQAIFLRLKEDALFQPLFNRTKLSFIPMGTMQAFYPPYFVGRFISRMFYIGASSHEINHQPVWALYALDLGQSSEGLVEGIDGWHIEMLPTQHREDIEGLKFSLWVNSLIHIYSYPKHDTFFHQTAEDGFFRKSYEHIVYPRGYSVPK